MDNEFTEYPDLILHRYPTDSDIIKLVFNTVYVYNYMYVRMYNHKLRT